MKARSIHLDHLLGRRVRGPDGGYIGRIEEICAEYEGRDLVVSEYHIGIVGFFERLSGLVVARRILERLHVLPRSAGYRVPWNDLDVSDVQHPVLTRPLDQLEELGRTPE